MRASIVSTTCRYISEAFQVQHLGIGTAVIALFRVDVDILGGGGYVEDGV